MIAKEFEKKYVEWKLDPNNTDVNQFISKLVEEHNTTADVIGRVLELCEWFNPNE